MRSQLRPVAADSRGTDNVAYGSADSCYLDSVNEAQRRVAVAATAVSVKSPQWDVVSVISGGEFVWPASFMLVKTG